MRRLLALLFLFVLLCSHVVLAVGSVTGTSSVVSGVRKYTFTWTSSMGGAVSGNASTLISSGRLMQVRFTPASGGTQPSDDYDVTLVTTDGIDLLAGEGTDLPNDASVLRQWDPPLFQEGSALDLVVSGAGSAKSGTVTVWVN